MDGQGQRVSNKRGVATPCTLRSFVAYGAPPDGQVVGAILRRMRWTRGHLEGASATRPWLQIYRAIDRLCHGCTELNPTETHARS